MQREWYPHGRRTEAADVWRGCYNKGLLLQHSSRSRRHVCDNNISPPGLRCYLWHGAKCFHYKPAVNIGIKSKGKRGGGAHGAEVFPALHGIFSEQLVQRLRYRHRYVYPLLSKKNSSGPLKHERNACRKTLL